MQDPVEIRILGLSNADKLDLNELVGVGNYRTEQAELEHLGEPFTIIATVLVTRAAVKGLVAFLAARSLRDAKREVELDVETVGEDGSVSKQHLKVTDTGSTMSAELAKTLSSVTGITVHDLVG